MGDLEALLAAEHGEIMDTRQVARVLRMQVDGVRKLVQRARLTPRSTGARGLMLFHSRDVARYLEDRAQRRAQRENRKHAKQIAKKRTKKLEVKATPEQIGRWDAAAAHAGEDRSEWVRRVLDEAAERETRDVT